ncbi:hypothetical protein A0256_22825 [Mucilaginibacter sp. PAMC 26640]|nr:hypothetical protein A0256_22825 [Mucilaginibacter sp. PAMC 26640]
MKAFSQLKKNLKKDFSNLKAVKIALLGDSATQFLTQAIRAVGYEYQLNLDIWEADFSQVERQIFDPTSDLYNAAPELIIIFQSTHKVLNKYSQLQPQQYHLFADQQLSLIATLTQTIGQISTAKVIFYNYPEINDSVFGSYANKVPASFTYQLRKLNYELMVYTAANPGFYLCDMAAVQNEVGRAATFQPSVYVNSEMVLSIDVLPLIATRTVDVIAAMYGKVIKCLILDLDNTIWGGVIGDDGLENIEIGGLGIGKAFTEFQYWAKKLKNRGIILAVCSKNTESVAKEPFEKHPDMVLRLEDITVFMANWDTKVENIRKIQAVLNIGFDSMVFLDDNPFERNIVRENIPGIIIPELPVDPAEYLEHLYNLNLFETISFSSEDLERTKLYQVAAKRVAQQTSFTNESDFLKSLDMISIVQAFNKFTLPRVAQLSQRSNQFNLRTVRHTEQDLEELISNEDTFTLSFTLEDKFGDNGLISAIVLKKDATDLFIDTWFMSCRVLKRGMESFVLNKIAAVAMQNNYTRIKAEYIPTAKNELVKDHYKNLGFAEQDGYWYLDLDSYQPKECYISTK